MKRLLALFLAIIMIFSLSACAQNTNSTSDTASDSAQFPVTVTDCKGRTVTVSEQPEKIVSGYYISTSLLIALGLEDKLVGIEAKADKRAIYSLSAPQLIELPNVGTAKEFDLEGCLALEPDLAILPSKVSNDTAETLESMGITVIFVNPESRELLAETVDMISAATGTSAEAEKLSVFTQKQETMLTEKLANAEKPRVYLGGNSDFLSTAGGMMYQSDLISLAGGENVAAEIEDTYWATVSYEQVFAWDPEYIILASDSSYTAQDVLSDPNLAGCTAIKNGNVYQMPNTAEAWDSPVPGGILGAVWTASCLYPDIISEDDCNDIIEEFYSTFYGFSYSEA